MVFKIEHVNLQNVCLNLDFWPLSSETLSLSLPGTLFTHNPVLANTATYYLTTRYCNKIIILPDCDTTAHLQPFLNPGSIPSTTFPLTGGVNSNLFKFEAKTWILAFIARFVSSDLKKLTKLNFPCD